MSANKPNLTFEEQITCAYLHYVRGVTQEILAAAYATNQGRVNEACVTIKDAIKRTVVTPNNGKPNDDPL